MAGRVVYFSGEFVPEREARVSIFDCALMYGDMAFEMTRTFDGRSFKLREHLERLYGSLRLLEIDCGLTIDEMREVDPGITEDVYSVLGVENSVTSRTSFGGTAPDNVRAQVKAARERFLG